MSVNDRIVETGAEFSKLRRQDVWKTHGGAIVSDGNTGEERIQITGPGGGNININNNVNSELAPNNKQTYVLGKNFSTTAGDNHETTNGLKEIRVGENLNIITGPQSFYNSPIADEWVEKNIELAAAKAAPEYNYGAVGNNTETVYQSGGTVDEESGAVEGGDFQPNESQADIPGLMEAKAADIAATEAKMGNGGSINMMSAKHVSLIAGTKAVAFDSGVMVPDARKVLKGYEVKDGKPEPTYTAVSNYESKDTSGAVPFGDVYISAGTKMRVVTGSGGLSIKTAGEANINTTGRLMLGGAEVSIAGGNKSNSGRITMVSDTDLYMEAGTITARNAPNINDIADNFHTFVTPQAIFTGNLHVMGDLVVDGNVTVNGSTGIEVPNGDVVASGVSLVNHTHTGDSGGTTSPPN